jgi:hypothetical protein
MVLVQVPTGMFFYRGVARGVGAIGTSAYALQFLNGDIVVKIGHKVGTKIKAAHHLELLIGFRVA